MPGVAVSTRQLCSCSPLLLQHSEDQTLLPPPPPPPPLRWFPPNPLGPGPRTSQGFVNFQRMLKCFCAVLLLFHLFLLSGGSSSKPHPIIHTFPEFMYFLNFGSDFPVSSSPGRKIYWDMSSYRRKFMRCHHWCTCKGWFPSGFPSCVTIQSPMTDVLSKVVEQCCTQVELFQFLISMILSRDIYFRSTLCFHITVIAQPERQLVVEWTLFLLLFR